MTHNFDHNFLLYTSFWSILKCFGIRKNMQILWSIISKSASVFVVNISYLLWDFVLSAWTAVTLTTCLAFWATQRQDLISFNFGHYSLFDKILYFVQDWAIHFCFVFGMKSRSPMVSEIQGGGTSLTDTRAEWKPWI